MAYRCPNCGASVSDSRTYVPFFDLGVCADCFHIEKKATMNNNQYPIEIIKLGGIYETHDHRKVKCVYIYANCGQAVYIFPDNPEAEPLTSDYRGKRYCGERLIIGEWKDKLVVDWSLYSRWYKWVAMNKGGQWYLHKDKPKSAQSCWMSNSSDMFIPKEYTPQFSGDWKDSLCERPEVEPTKPTKGTR